MPLKQTVLTMKKDLPARGKMAMNIARKALESRRRDTRPGIGTPWILPLVY